MKLRLSDFVPPIAFKILRSKSKEAVYTKVDNNGNLVPEKLSNILNKNESLKNSHSGKRCFIIGTGSSIKSQNLKLLKNDISMGLNEFFLHPDYNEIKPKYVVFSGFGIHNVPAEKQILWYQDYEKRIAGISTPIINICDYNYISKNKLLTKSGIKFMRYENNFDVILEEGIDATKNMYASQGVGAMAIQNAIYIGFKEIVLVGFDHDWLLRMFDSKPTHFYDHNTSIIYKGHREVEGITLQYQLQSLSKLFLNYIQLKKYADKKGVTILNATEGGMLDVFPLVDFESLFKKD